MKHKTNLAAFCLLVFGLYFNFVRHLPDMGQSIFGDDGDGLFNLWLLENVRLFFSHFDVSHFIQTNAFFPENRLTLFWSDTLIAPGLLYTLIFAFCKNQVLSYNLLVLAAVAIAFLVHFVFFRTVVGWAHEKAGAENIPIATGASTVLLLALTYAYTFGMARMMYTVHFQNQWAFLTILALLGMVKVFDRSYRAGTALICFSFTFLCYSTMYYGLVLGLLGLIFLIYVLCTFEKRELVRLFQHALPAGVATLALTLPIIYAYTLTGKNRVSVGAFASIEDIFQPFPDTLLSSIWSRLGFVRGEFNHEILIYPGWFFLIFAIPVVIYGIKQCWHYIRTVEPLRRAFNRILLLNGLAWLVPEKSSIAGFVLKPFLTTVAAGAFFFFLFYSLSVALRTGRMKPGLVLVLIFGLIFYGITLGLSVTFSNATFNPSLFGILSLVLPWLGALRAAGRFGVLATGMLSAVVLYVLILKGRIHKPLVAGLVVMIAGLHIVEQIRPPYVNTYDVQKVLHPTHDEAAFFQALKRPMIFFPAHPFHKNTYFQLLTISFRNVQMVNGYSGISSVVMDRVMTGRDGENVPSLELLSDLRRQGVGIVVFAKWRYTADQLGRVAHMLSTHVFESENFLAFGL